MSQLVLALHSI